MNVIEVRTVAHRPAPLPATGHMPPAASASCILRIMVLWVKLRKRDSSPQTMVTQLNPIHSFSHLLRPKHFLDTNCIQVLGLPRGTSPALSLRPVPSRTVTDMAAPQGDRWDVSAGGSSNRNCLVPVSAHTPHRSVCAFSCLPPAEL